MKPSLTFALVFLTSLFSVQAQSESKHYWLPNVTSYNAMVKYFQSWDYSKNLCAKMQFPMSGGDFCTNDTYIINWNKSGGGGNYSIHCPDSDSKPINDLPNGQQILTNAVNLNAIDGGSCVVQDNNSFSSKCSGTIPFCQEK
jgi:hypothetical protein